MPVGVPFGTPWELLGAPAPLGERVNDTLFTLPHCEPDLNDGQWPHAHSAPASRVPCVSRLLED